MFFTKRAVTSLVARNSSLKTFSRMFSKVISNKERSTPALAFDVDGVLLRGPNPIPGAREALEKLRKKKIPFMLLTNGGGSIEADKASTFEMNPK